MLEKLISIFFTKQTKQKNHLTVRRSGLISSNINSLKKVYIKPSISIKNEMDFNIDFNSRGKIYLKLFTACNLR